MHLGAKHSVPKFFHPNTTPHGQVSARIPCCLGHLLRLGECQHRKVFWFLPFFHDIVFLAAVQYCGWYGTDGQEAAAEGSASETGHDHPTQQNGEPRHRTGQDQEGGAVGKLQLSCTSCNQVKSLDILKAVTTKQPIWSVCVIGGKKQCEDRTFFGWICERAGGCDEARVWWFIRVSQPWLREKSDGWCGQKVGHFWRWFVQSCRNSHRR